MTWNEQNKAQSIMDVLEGTVEEWYDQVDGLLKASDFIPGNYEYSVNVAYANSGEFDEGGQNLLTEAPTAPSGLRGNVNSNV